MVQGDESAFERFVKDNQSRVFNLCLTMLKNSDDAEDLSQEIFITCYRKIDTFKGDSKLTTWLYRIATNKCLEEIRKQKRKQRWLTMMSFWKMGENQIDPPSFDHPGLNLENKERAKILMSKMEELPLNQRLAFTLHQVDGMSYQEIAEVMEMSLSAVESLIFRGRKNLQKTLREYYEKELI